ncbi:MAG: lysophospholipase [Gammaproteobacteria bacterium]
MLQQQSATCRWLAAVVCIFQFTACAPQIQARSDTLQAPELTRDEAVMADGYRLPLERWLPENGSPCRIVLAVHGFNDFHMAFESLAGALTKDCSAVYAYDQRGFGATDQRGIWPGEDRLVEDVITLASLLQQRHPELPLYLIGESMGAAIVMLAMAGNDPPRAEGAVLLAPAVWARDIQPWYMRMGLWFGVRLMPGLKLSSRLIGIEASDVPEVQQYWREHPLVIQRTRVDALHGVSKLMGSALDAAGNLQTPALILYGGKDEVIPPEAACALLEQLPDPQSVPWRFVYYPQGYHLLTRDSRAQETIMDTNTWLKSRQALLPSGRETDRDRAEKVLCQ